MEKEEKIIISQDGYASVIIKNRKNHISIYQGTELCIISKENIKSLIAALQQFLPKEEGK